MKYNVSVDSLNFHLIQYTSNIENEKSNRDIKVWGPISLIFFIYYFLRKKNSMISTFLCEKFREIRLKVIWDTKSQSETCEKVLLPITGMNCPSSMTVTGIDWEKTIHIIDFKRKILFTRSEIQYDKLNE